MVEAEDQHPDQQPDPIYETRKGTMRLLLHPMPVLEDMLLSPEHRLLRCRLLPLETVQVQMDSPSADLAMTMIQIDEQIILMMLMREIFSMKVAILSAADAVYQDDLRAALRILWTNLKWIQHR